MERAVIFRYDEAQRRVRAAGSHNLPLEAFAGVRFTVETAPIARQALAEDRVLDVPESPGSSCPSATGAAARRRCSCARRSPPAGAGPA